MIYLHVYLDILIFDDLNFDDLNFEDYRFIFQGWNKFVI